MMAGAGWLFFRWAWGQPEPGELGFFYDVSAHKLFTGPRQSPPPIRGVDGPEEDGFRAVVISTTGHPMDKGSWKVAYLERFSPELKEASRTAQRTGGELSMGRQAMQSHRFVRFLEDTEWHPMDSPEAEVILNSWAAPGTNGVVPILCTP